MKRVICTLLVIALLACALPAAAAGTGGTVSDPLISLSYMTGTFLPDLLAEAGRLVTSQLRAVYDAAYSRLSAFYDSVLLRLGAEGYTLSDSFIGVTLGNGQSVSMLTGGMFMLTSGAARVSISRGTVINISTGEEVASGSPLTLYQRYFCAEDTAAAFTASGAASCLADGYYSTDGAVGPGVPPPPASFTDVPSGTWFYDSVHYCVSVGLFEGMGDGSFSPGTKMNMAQLLQVLYRMSGGSTAGSSPYWYSAALDWSVRAGLITEAGFSAGDYVTREYFIKMFYACAAYVGGYDMTPRADLTRATDYSSIAPESYDAISWAVATGIIVGTDASTLTIDPGAQVNRATVCQMIMRYLRGA